MEAYRVIIEVLKFVSPEDVLRAASMVHSRWVEAGESRELWYDYLPAQVRTEEIHPKYTYRTQFVGSVFVLLETKLLRFYLGPQCWQETPLAHRVDVDWKSSVVRVDTHTIFVFAVDSKKNNTFRVNVHTGQLKALTTLMPHRDAMGVILFDKSVYAFCGQRGSKATEISTKLDVQYFSWKPLPNALSKRRFFNPSEHSGLIYLLGGTDEESGETYSPTTSSFTSLPMKWSEDCVSIFVDSTLFVINQQEALTVTHKKKPKKRPVPTGLLDGFWSGYPPILYNGQLVVLQRSRGRVVKLDLNTLEWVSFQFEGGKMPRRKCVGHAGAAPILQPPMAGTQQPPQQPPNQE